MEDQIPLTSRGETSNTSIGSEGSDSARASKVAVHPLRALLGVFGTAWRDVKLISEYIRKKHLRKFWTHFALAVVLVLALTSSGLIVIPSRYSKRQYCDPGGNFNFNQTYNPWAREHTFQITLGFGRLSFAQAKAIDVVWDVVVGRGGQFLLTATCFHVFSKSLNLRLEQPKASISYDGFRAIVFERPTLSSTLMLIFDLRSTTGWRTKASVLWMVIASIYVVAFPTMVSAMTGYSANVDPYFDDGTGGGKLRIPESGYFHRAIYLITGADRIEGMSLDATYLVGNRGFGYPDYGPDGDYFDCLNRRNFSIPRDQGDCLLAHGITQYVSAYGARMSQTANTTLLLPNNRSIPVQSPGLTIETFNTGTEPFIDDYYDYRKRNLTLVNITTPCLYTTTSATTVLNQTHLNSGAGTCDSQATYLWGFSFILLFGFFVVTAIWVLGMYVMWVHTLCHSRLDRVGRTMGFYRGVADMSNAMWKDSLREPGELASDAKIRELLAQKLNGGRVAFDELNRDKLPPVTWASTHEFGRFRRGVPSLNGWTKTWGLLHWTWFLSFTVVGLVWFFHPLVFMTGTRSSAQFATIMGFVFAGVCWMIALSLLLAVIPGAKQLCRLVPHSNALSEPRPLARWICIVVLTVSGGLSCFIATAYVLFGVFPSSPSRQTDLAYFDLDFAFFNVICVHMGIAGLFWTVAAIMFLTGLFSTMWRWSTQPVRIVPRL